jgi:nitronate monooxygenase
VHSNDSALSTALTERLGLAHPIIAAPLGRGSTSDFVTKVADAGALAFVGLGFIPEEAVAEVTSHYNAASGGRFGVNFSLTGDQRGRVKAALEAGARVFSLWYGDPAVCARLIKHAGATLFWTVGSPSEAVRAADLGVDFVVVQGSEAGGHLVGKAPQMTLLPAVVDAAKGVPVIVAGGIADGRGLAAALCLGACGIWMGTRFLASAEAGNHSGHKQRIVDAGLDDLERTSLFDGGWPDGPHRIIRNSTFSSWERSGRPPPGQRPAEGQRIGTYPDGRPLMRYDMAAPWEEMDGDWEATALYAGLSAELVRRIEPVAAIINSTSRQAAHILTAASWKSCHGN